MKVSTVKDYFDQQMVIEHYARAVNSVGLWASEEMLFTQYFNWDDSLLELGCGAGRVSIGLWEIGYRYLLATDLAKNMVEEGRRINQVLDYGVAFQQADATALNFEDNLFDGAVFGFNGLMQIPKRENRRRAMAEIFRVIAPGSYFIFTTHDRENRRHKAFWEDEKKRWERGIKHPDVDEFGDVYWDTPEGGMMYIHSPLKAHVRDDAKAVGFKIEREALRSSLCVERESVREFSDDCRFWVLQKPLSSK
ncbi:MAG: class I SAM-dependent methyltransferase [Opitutales bacterium]